MKVYFLYLLREGLEPTLYAYTTKKQVKEDFLEERNEKMFYIKEVEMSKKDFFDFESTKKEYELARRGYESKSSPSLTSEPTHIYITSTGYEEIDTYEKSDQFIYELAIHDIPYVEILNKEVLNILNNLYYFEIQKWATVDNYFFSGVKSFDFDSLNLKPDMFSIFIKLYGYTMKK